MPYKISKSEKKNCYRVINKITGKVHAKCTTLEKAKAQVRYMGMVDKVNKIGELPTTPANIRKLHKYIEKRNLLA
jgi:hypothetical protein